MHSALIRLLLTVACGLLLVPGSAVAAVAPTGSLGTPRTQLTATALPGGATTTSVLAAGGYNAAGTPQATAERYDPATGAWTPTGAMNAPHAAHHAILLPSGNVVVVSGRSLPPGAIRGDSLTTELYDPVKNAWNLGAAQPTFRVDDTATLTPFRAGPRIVVAGGRATGGAAVKTVDSYIPAGNTWAALPDMAFERRNHAAVTLPDGRLMVAGGFDANGGLLRSTEIYDEPSNSWILGPPMTFPRADFTLSVVDATHVLAVGGITPGGGGNAATSSAEVLNPTSGGWQTAGSMAVARTGQQATVVRSGWVVLTGGANAAAPGGLDSAEHWTPTNGWGGLYNLPGATAIGGARISHAAAAIPQSDEVLVAGGGLLPVAGPGTVTATAARWTPDKPAIVPPTTPPVVTPPQPQTQQQPPPGAVPVEGRSLVASAIAGTVYVRIGTTNEYRLLAPGEPIPVGTVLDTTDGRVRLVAAVGGGQQTAWFWGGTFTVLQPAGADGYVEIRLFGKPVCKKASSKKAVRAVTKKAVRAVKRKKKPRVWGDGKGRFRTRGEHSSATVTGTKWLVEERCTGTFTKVARGTVAVRDFTRHKTVSIKAGKNYLARPPRR